MGDQPNRLLLEVEFTHRWYRAFLERLRAEDYDCRGFADPPRAGEVALRHDVDLSLESALEMARIEADVGVTSTYFVLLTSPLYNVMAPEQREFLRRIEAMGHDVGLHFSTHAYPELDRQPPAAAIERRVGEERDVLSGILAGEPAAVSFHMPPDYVLGESFDAFQSTYAPAYFEDVEYVADSSQRWRDDPPTVGPGDDPMQALTHPGLWGAEDADFAGRVEAAIESSCRTTQEATRTEFLRGGSD